MSNKNDAETHAGFAGPGYMGFGGSVGYSGTSMGGVSGAYAGGSGTEGPWRPVPDTHHDDRIRADIQQRLEQADDVAAEEIEVDVEAGAVTLSGRVATRDMKHAAEEHAERVPGVQRVHNRLHVDEPLLEELAKKLGLGTSKLL
jgi:osmotically-inducible protein OsmY